MYDVVLRAAREDQEWPIGLPLLREPWKPGRLRISSSAHDKRMTRFDEGAGLNTAVARRLIDSSASFSVKRLRSL